MNRIVSRLLLRAALVAASLAWAGFVFTHTIGDPGRGERIATAVLADDEARAEIVAPVTDAIVSGAGLPDDQRILVADRVDGLLADPATARTFIDPFAGSWARMLGEDDPRPAEFDLAPILDDLAALVPELADVLAVENYVDQPVVVDSLDAVADPSTLDPGVVDPNAILDAASAEPVVPLGSVPLPRTQLRWMDSARNWIDAATLPLAVLAAGLVAIAFAIGERRRVLRRAGWWAVLAGMSWVVLPPLLVWAAQKWASGADAVVAVGLGEAVSGLRPTAVLLVLAGASSIAASFAPAFRTAPDPAAPEEWMVPDDAPPARRPERPARRPAGATTPTTPVAAPPNPIAYGPLAAGRAADRPARFGRGQVIGAPPRRTVDPTAEMPAVRPSAADADPDGDALWDYYGS